MAVTNTLIKANAAALYDEINNGGTLTNTTIATNDLIGIADISDTTGKKITINNLATYINNNININRTIGRWSSSVDISLNTLQTLYNLTDINVFIMQRYMTERNYTPTMVLVLTNNYIDSFYYYIGGDYILHGTCTWTYYNGTNIIATDTHTASATGGQIWEINRNNLNNCTKITYTETASNINTANNLAGYEFTPTSVKGKNYTANHSSQLNSLFGGWYIK